MPGKIKSVQRMIRLAIQDANIMIDLVKTGMFARCLALDIRFMTTELILAELHDEQVQMIQPHISSGQFTVIPLSADDLSAVLELSAEDNRLSLPDWSGIYFAKVKEAILLSGDKRVRDMAIRRSIEVRGILWLMDEMLRAEILTRQEACKQLKALMEINSRLPEKDCNSRMDKWCG